MNRHPRHRARRLAALAAVLGLYLTGANYCLLGAWSGDARMACLALPGSGPAGAACHHAAPTSDAPAERPAAQPSCCPDPVVVPAGVSLAAEVALGTPCAVLAAAPAPSAPPVSAWHGRRTLPDGQPPTRLARAPHAPRAPPLT